MAVGTAAAAKVATELSKKPHDRHDSFSVRFAFAAAGEKSRAD